MNNQRNDFSIIFIIMSIISLLSFCLSGESGIVFLIIGVFSFIGSAIITIMHFKYAKISLFISLLVVAIHIIALLLSINFFGAEIDKTKTLVFKNKAINFLDNTFENYYLSEEANCDKPIKLKKKIIAGNNSNISPFGGQFDYDNSYIIIDINKDNEKCVYQKYIYLTDGKHSLGTKDNPILKENIMQSPLNDE